MIVSGWWTEEYRLPILLDKEQFEFLIALHNKNKVKGEQTILLTAGGCDK